MWNRNNCVSDGVKRQHVYGVEVVPEAIEDAKTNAELNGLHNTTFVAGAAEDVILEWQKQGIQPDVVTVDPQEKGVIAPLLKHLNNCNPKKLFTSRVIRAHN